MRWDLLAVDEEDAGEAQGTVEVASIHVVHPFVAHPILDPAACLS